jgi:putative glutamine amidotransferase
MAQAADQRDLPILAICRGAQLLNVARGGDLYQHLPDDAGDKIAHRLPGKGQHAGHEVTVEADSHLARALGGASEAYVNSYHHQAAHRLGRGVRAVAWAPDGVIEGIEIPDREFALGVQWHAEAIVEQAEQLNLFREFVAAAGRFGSGVRSGLRRAA